MVSILFFFFTRVFGKRYREVIRGWEASLRAGGVNDRRWVFITSILSHSYEFDFYFFYVSMWIELIGQDLL